MKPHREDALLRLASGIAEASSEAAVCAAVASGLYDKALGYDFVAVLLVDRATGERVLVASQGWKEAPELSRREAQLGRKMAHAAFEDRLLVRP